MRDELQHKVQSERTRLESELARNAAELERARQERAAAEAAREAAAAEAQQIVADFQEAHERKRMQEEAEMQVEPRSENRLSRFLSRLMVRHFFFSSRTTLRAHALSQPSWQARWVSSAST